MPDGLHEHEHALQHQRHGAGKASCDVVIPAPGSLVVKSGSTSDERRQRDQRGERRARALGAERLLAVA